MTERLARLVPLLAAALVAWAAARWPAEMSSVALRDASWGWLTVAGVAVALAPTARVRLTQDVGLVVIYAGQRLAARGLGAGLGPWWDLPLGIAISLLPWSRPWLRRAGIWTAIAAFVAFPFLPARWSGAILHPVVQLLFCAALTDGLGARDAARYTLARMVAPRMSVLPGDALGVDRAPRAMWVGVGWLAAGLALARVPSRELHEALDPWLALRAGRADLALAESLAAWALLASHTFARMLVAGGTLRLLGMPITAPIDAPWRATDLLDYWRRVHTWRSTLFRAAFFRHLGWRGPLAVLAIFLLSGLQHTAGDPDPWPGMVVWALLGALATLNARVNQRLARRRVAAWMAGERPEPRGALAALAIGVGLLALHGFVQTVVALPGVD